jgi:hypothetical protein
MTLLRYPADTTVFNCVYIWRVFNLITMDVNMHQLILM